MLYHQLIDRIREQLDREETALAQHERDGRLKAARCARQAATILRRILREAGELDD